MTLTELLDILICLHALLFWSSVGLFCKLRSRTRFHTSDKADYKSELARLLSGFLYAFRTDLMSGSAL